HRDIKPENIMIRQDGLAKVLDFGLAKPYNPIAASGDNPTAKIQTGQVQTGPWTVMGTAPYMSPEQARGLKLDARSDLFSLGVVLYEMLTGIRPFEGDTTSDTMAAILMTEPPAVSIRCPGIPESFDHVPVRALAKDREQRYQTASEFIADLEPLQHHFQAGRDADFTSTLPVKPVKPAGKSFRMRLAAAVSSPQRMAILVAAVILPLLAGAFLFYRSARESRSPIDSLAVLPFVDSSGSSDNEYISQGITESLINTLSELSTLKVMSYNVVSHLKGPDTDPSAVRQKLDVKSVLVGRITEHGDDLTINVELVDARNGAHVWGKRYDRSIASLQQTQEEISTELANQLLLKLTGKDKQVLAKQYIAKPEAYQLYLQGRYALSKQDAEWSKKAIGYFNNALKVDPGYPLPYAGLADSYSLLADYGAMSPNEALPQARRAAEQALKLDDSLAEAHTALGHILLSDWNWDGAESQYRRALELKPEYAIAHQWYANLLAAKGRFTEAIAEAREALREEPVLSNAGQSLGRQLYLAGQYTEAVDQLRKTLDLDPNSVTARVTLGLALLEVKHYNEAIEQLNDAVQRSAQNPAQPAYLAELARAYALAGDRTKAEETLSHLEQIEKTSYVSPFFMAEVYTALGKDDQAFGFLDQAFEQRSSELIFINVWPGFSRLHNDPRFRHILDRIRLD
ncbi:MAG: protein kinase domain-containing protein, partial [Blastocatellia bacterium]